jgi:tRNA dimethylallyltransferase
MGVSGRRQDVVLLVGPTAVGKTAVSLAMATAMPARIVSLDSRQVYRGMDIGTAKPSAEERRRVRHYLVDIADPDQTLTLPVVIGAALAAVDETLAASHVPVLVGGTGQYVRALTEGWQVPDVEADPDYRRELERSAAADGGAALAARLAEVDPESAASIDPRNVRRVIRALEVHRATGRPFSAQRGRNPPPYSFLWVGLDRPRPDLYGRIDLRVADMMARGLEHEVLGLLAAGYSFDLPAMSGLGYGEWRDYVAGSIDREEVARRIRKGTRRLARAQGAWFPSADARIRWFDLAEVPVDRVVAWAIETLRG